MLRDVGFLREEIAKQLREHGEHELADQYWTQADTDYWLSKQADAEGGTVTVWVVLAYNWGERTHEIEGVFATWEGVKAEYGDFFGADEPEKVGEERRGVWERSNSVEEWTVQ